MTEPTRVLLFVSDRPVLSSLQFSLAIEGFEVADGAAGSDCSAAAALVIDQSYSGNGLAALAALRALGYSTPTMILATHPTPRMRSQAAALGAVLIEKPLLGDELTRALRTALNLRQAA